MKPDEFRQTWREQTEPHTRLKWARVYWQIKASSAPGTAKDAASSLGMKEGTYRAYEREPGLSKTIALGHQEAIRFGRKFGISWPWLLLGEGSPFDDQLPPAQQRVIEAMGRVSDEQQAELANIVERLLKVG